MIFAIKVLTALCCLCVTNGIPLTHNNFIPSDPSIYQINMQQANLVPKTKSNANCPSMESCNRCPIVGYELDENGCEICGKCKTTTLFETDIIVDSKTIDHVKEKYGLGCNETGKHRVGTKRGELEWPKTGDTVYVPFHMDFSLEQSQQDNILKAMEQYHEKTCIKFIPRTNENDYIRIFRGEGCYSYVGKIGGKQDVSIGKNCDIQRGTIIHELMHALGFWHEQSRPDRDDYITINYNNMDPRVKNNFQIEYNSDNYGSDYDIGSVMHYGGYFFSNNGQPTIVKSGTNEAVKHQREGFSDQDLVQIRNKYCGGSTATVAPENCFDKTINCQSIDNLSQQCKVPSFKRECMKTCGCTDIQTATATTTTTTTEMTTTTQITTTEYNENCKDKNENCAFWQGQGFCQGEHYEYMKTDCPKSCNHCTTDSYYADGRYFNNKEVKDVCEDKHNSCPGWADLNYCVSGDYIKYMKTHCSLSCTKKNVPDLCILPAPSTTQGPASGCEDLHPNCPGWEASGYCVGQYETYMMQNCKSSCRQCDGIQATTTNANVIVGEIYNGKCGIPFVELKYADAGLRHRIVGGHDARRDSIPWIVSLRNTQNVNFCGATIISRKFVVTALHCFFKNKKYQSQLYKQIYGFVGKYHRFSYVKDLGQKKIKFSNIIIHGDYDHDSSNNDIALLEVETPLTFTKHVRPVCLPAQDQEVETSDENNKNVAIVAGWGETEGTSNSRYLQQVSVRTISNNQCNQWLNKEEVNDNMLCAGYEQGKKDSCQGDSGGPLTMLEHGQNFLVGIVSWGYGCADFRRPGVYTRVSRYINWIQRNTGGL